MDMSSYEIADLIFGLVGYGMTALALYFTVISGYLVVAFLVGTDLSRFQTIFISFLFVVFSVILSFGTYSFFAGAYEYGRGAGPISFWVAPTLAAAEILGVIGALYFMYETRNRGDV